MPSRPDRTLLLLLTAAVVLAATPTATAQMLPAGTWAGEIAAADGARQSVEANIERCATGFRVALDVDGRTAETETATWERGQLRFELPRLRMPGTVLPRTLACTLEHQDDGSLAGACRAGRTDYSLRLAPPADAAFGCD